MIRSGNSTRFTQHEISELRQVGLDLADVKCQNDLDAELTRWAHTLAHERFDLLERIAAEMAKAKGVKLPPKLSVAK
jgi:recombinational DNA repair ATPase RecF